MGKEKFLNDIKDLHLATINKKDIVFSPIINDFQKQYVKKYLMLKTSLELMPVEDKEWAINEYKQWSKMHDSSVIHGDLLSAFERWINCQEYLKEFDKKHLIEEFKKKLNA